MKQKFLLPAISYLLLFISIAEVPGLISTSSAQESRISVIESWVEDGYEFHVGFDAPPSNAMCSLHGEGVLEFEVQYFTPASNSPGSVYGVAAWYPGPDEDQTIQTYGKAIGPQALCTKFSPCRIRAVRLVKAWCPPREGPLFSW